MAIITLEMLHQHVLELAADLQIDWIHDGRMPAADHETRTLTLHKIKSETAYAVALHEIGHLRDGRVDDILIEERRAWEWARGNALVWTPTMQHEADVSVRGYEVAVDGYDDARQTDLYYDQNWRSWKCWYAATRTGNWSTTHWFATQQNLLRCMNTTTRMQHAGC
jgi:hypothetical protein